MRGTSTMRIERLADNGDPLELRRRRQHRDLHMTRRLRDERGAVLVMAAVMIPVFLLMTALVVDVGNWYTHKRQLQNRADAAAFAAGVEYAKNWKACVQTADATLRASTGGEIADAARQYAGDPEASDYSTGTLPATLRNTEIANQGNLDVVVNSNDPDYTDDTDYTDGGGSPPQGNPCFLHTTGDDISAPGHWTDVRVKERDLPSLFGSVGLPLSRNGARARIEIRPAISGHRFLPLAVPNNVITQVQVRYYDECRDPSHTERRSRRATSRRSRRRIRAPSPGSGRSGASRTAARRPPGFSVTLPSYGGCGQAYLPDRRRGADREPARRDQLQQLHVRAAARDAVRRLLLAALADPRLERRQPEQPGPDRRRSPDRRLRHRRTRTSARCPSRRPTAASARTSTSTGATETTARPQRPGQLHRHGERHRGDAVGRPRRPGRRIQPVHGPGQHAHREPRRQRRDRRRSTGCDDDNVAQLPGGAQPCRNGNQNTVPVQRHRARPPDAFVGTTGTAGAVAFVRTSLSAVERVADPAGHGVREPARPAATSSPSSRRSGSAACSRRASTRRSASTTRRRTRRSAATRTTPRDRSSRRSATAASRGTARTTSTATSSARRTTRARGGTRRRRRARGRGQWFSYGDQGAGFGVNSSNNPWRCVLTAPGLSTGQIGDDIAVATDNCDNINNNSCQQFDCNFDGNYDGKGATPGWNTAAAAKLGRTRASSTCSSSRTRRARA